jgi:hypothetical protein
MQISSFGRTAFVCLLASLFSASTAITQEFRATLSGRVTDSTGAVVVKAKVTVVEVSSKTTYAASTNNDGTYYIPYVLPGTYSVTVTAKGFKTAIQDNVRLFASQGFGQNFQLQVGGDTERVEVTDAPPELETTTGSGDNLILQREMETVPLNGRQAYNLIGTTPGSQSYNTSAGPGGTGTRGWDDNNGYSIGGGAPQGDAALGSFNQFTLNGINITQQTTFANQSAGAWSVSPNLDTISEVNVMTTNYDAQFSRTAGGTVNVVTKSGGNKFHGDLFETYSGTLFDANTFSQNLIGLPRQGYVENQYDGTFGGPIKKDKLFFFFGFEGYNESISGGVEVNVPPAYLRPNFSGNPSNVTGIDFGLASALDPAHFGPGSGEPAGIPIYQPGTASCPASEGATAAACSNSKDLYQTPFPNDTIPLSQVGSTALAVMKYIPLPNIASAANFATGDNYYLPAPILTHYYQPTIRVDYNLNDKNKLYSYYEWQTGAEYKSTNGLTGIAANGNINQLRENWAAGQDITHTFSPTFVLDAKVSFSRFQQVSPDGDVASPQNPSTIGLSMPLPGTTNIQDLPEINVADNYTGGILGQSTSTNSTIFGNSVVSDATTNLELDVDLTKIKGNHSLHIGGSIAHFQYGDWNYGGHPNGDFNFGSSFTQYNPTNSGCYGNTPGSTGNACNSSEGNGSSLADFYLGYPGPNPSHSSNGGGIDWEDTNAEGQPVYGIYFQDNWRVTPRLTLNLGIRYDVQRGLRDRHNALDAGMCLTCVNPVSSDANFQANVANATNAAAWSAAGLTAPTQALGGQIFPGVNGQGRDAYFTDWSNVGPRAGFAYTLNSKSVIRGGYGLVYQGGLEGGSNIGFAETTPYIDSPNGGVSPSAAFQSGSPYGGVSLIVPPGSSQGLLSNVGIDGNSFDFPQRKMPLGEVFSFGGEHELPGRIVVDARYAGNYSYRNRVMVWLTAANTSLSEWNAAIANPNLFTAEVPNPYYNVAAAIQGGSGCGTSPTVWALDLLQPFSQYCSAGSTAALVGRYNDPIGRNWYNGLEVKGSRHVYGSSRGLFFQAAYTWSKTINGNGYPFGWPFQGSAAPVPGGVSTHQQHVIASTDRDQILSLTPVWDLPFGKGSLLLPNPSAPLGFFINGWTLSSVIQVQSGQPVSLNNGWAYSSSCKWGQMHPAGKPSMGNWLRNDSATISNCWSQVPNVEGYTWGLQSTPQQATVVRQPTAADFDISLMKTTQIREGKDFILRLDAFNALNSPQFGGPDSNPGDGPPVFTPASGWSGFGTIGPTQQNFPRILKVSGKITF